MSGAGRRVSVLVALAAIGACALSAARAEAAPAGPVWSLRIISFPTNFSPNSVATGAGGGGPGYQIVATNIGDSRTTGSFEIVATLPPGVTVAPPLTPAEAPVIPRPESTYGREHVKQTEEPTLSCLVAGQMVTCTGVDPGVGAGERAQLTIPVKLETSLPETIEAEATVSGGGAAPASATVKTKVLSTPAPFDFLEGSAGFGGGWTEADGSASTQAGSHPFQIGIGLGFPSDPAEAGQGSVLTAGGGLRDASVTLPAGVAVNPQATLKCLEPELESESCPEASQVGTVRLILSLGAMPAAGTRQLYNMAAPPGSPGEFGFEVLEGTYVHLLGHVRSDGDYELSAGASDVLAKVTVLGVETTLWGNPSDSSHDGVRGACLFTLSKSESTSTCPVTRTNKALLTLPTSCTGPLSTTASADSWLEPGVFHGRAFETSAMQGCSALEFDPTIALTPDTSAADSPAGLTVGVHIPQNEEFENEAEEPQLAEAHLKDAKVTLPAGVTINPSAANGRGACSAAQIGLTTPVGQAAHPHFSAAPASCPDNAKVGTVEVETPLLDHPLPGSIYLAAPYENPFGTLLAIYIAVYDPVTGIVAKLPGRVEADQASGQLTTTFTENPQLPFEDFRLQFFGGPRAALRTPGTCGSYPVASELTPWSGTPAVQLSQTIPVDHAPGGGPCAASPAEQPNQPSFDAGTVSPLAGSYSPFVMHLSRADGSQELKALNVTLPQGLTGKLAGTPYCPEAAIAAAAAKSGREEQASPSCPAASEVGKVTVGAGAGSLPYYAQGKAYLAGPYKGAPLSLAIVTPAVAGPFDLGTVVVRAALRLDLYTARITVESDPLPTILQGIPLDVRSIAVEVGKPEFTINPTSCEPMAISGQALTIAGQAASLSSRFQAAGCKKLGFKPSLKISLKGNTKRTGHPALKAIVTYPTKGSYANIARARVSLPHSEFLDQAHLNNVCTQPQLASQTCPAKSIYGHAKAWTPLLDQPLEGPVYLGVGFGHKLPDLVAELNGQIRVLLHGKVDTDSEDGIRNTFEAVPDAPVSKFVLEMEGGKRKGLLVNSENICRKVNKATVEFSAQNGDIRRWKAPISTSCGRSKKHGAGKRHHHG